MSSVSIFKSRKAKVNIVGYSSRAHKGRSILPKQFNKIVFIDSKMWVGAHYKWIGFGTIGRIRRKEFKEIHTNFSAAVGYLSQTFSKQQVMAMTIIHSNNNSRASFDNSNASKVMLINGQDAIREIGNWFAKDLTGMIDLNSMQKLQYQLK